MKIGGFRISPQTPLKRPKEGPRPFLWKPSRGYGGFRKTGADASLCAVTGDVGTGDERWRLWCLLSFRVPALWKTRETTAW